MVSSAYEQDQRTQAQIEAISNEIRASQPLTSQLQPISTLLQCYEDSKNENGETDYDNASPNNFIEGSRYLTKKYSSWRQIRGDGNCYYRAFLYAVCEQLLRRCTAREESALKELKRLQTYAENSLDEVTKYGYDRFAIEMFHEELVGLFDFLSPAITDGDGNNITFPTLEELHSKLTEENSTSDYCTWYLRVITAAYLKNEADRFVHFLDDPNYFDVPTFCAREVEPMGRECTSVTALALAEAMGVRIKIEYLDGRELQQMRNGGGSSMGLALHEFGPPDQEMKNCLEIILLYRPGHYDILY